MKQDTTEWARELSYNLKFDHSTKWYMHDPKSVLENETCKLLRDFEIQTVHLIPTRRLDLMIVNKKENLPNSELCRPGRPQSENQRKRKER